MVSTAVCAQPGCNFEGHRTCISCSRRYCPQHVELEFGVNFGFYRCQGCQERRRGGGGQAPLIIAGALAVSGLLLPLLLGLSAGGLLGVAVMIGSSLFVAFQSLTRQIL